MNRKELKSYFNNATQSTQESKIKHLVDALAKVNMMPSYKDLLSYEEIGLFLWIYGCGPSVSSNKLAIWVQNQIKRIRAGWEIGEVKVLPNHAIADVLLKYQETKNIESLSIHIQTGAVFIRWKNGEFECISSYSTIHSNTIDFSIKELTIFSGTFIKDLAYRLRLDYIIDEHERQQQERKMKEKLFNIADIKL